MKLFAILVLTAFLVRPAFCQTGTVGDPFTSLTQAVAAASAGTYYFSISGTTFNTYVDANGYVLVAIDFGNGVGNLPQGSSLTTSARGIMNTTVLAAITTHTEIRITASSGNIDVTSSNATLLARITSNTTLHTGSADNAINNGWSGTGSTWFTNNASGTSPTANTLHRKIFHPSGNTNTFHWQPRINQQRETHSSGEISSGQSLRLWVRDNSVPLPIELLEFKAEIENNQGVSLTWTTASEMNNDYFTIERSKNGIDWMDVETIDGAGNSSSLLRYSTLDPKPYDNISYYRLKQTDFDGQFEYSAIETVNIKQTLDEPITVFPNPIENKLTITGFNFDLKQFRIFNSLGQDVTTISKITVNELGEISVDFTKLNSGLYFIKTDTITNKIYKQ